MEIIIRSKNVDVTEHIKSYVNEKLLSVFRFLPQVAENEKKDEKFIGEGADRAILEVELEKITGGEKGRIFRTEAQIKIAGKVIKAEHISETLKSSIDEVRYELQRQVKEYKEKRETVRRKGGKEAKEKRIE